MLLRHLASKRQPEAACALDLINDSMQDVLRLLHGARARQQRWQEQLREHFVQPLQQHARRSDVRLPASVSVSCVSSISLLAFLQ